MIPILKNIINNTINKQINNIKKEQFGFINNDCSVFILSILIHCFENNVIFDNKQYKNIINIANKLNNE